MLCGRLPPGILGALQQSDHPSIVLGHVAKRLFGTLTKGRSLFVLMLVYSSMAVHDRHCPPQASLHTSSSSSTHQMCRARSGYVATAARHHSLSFLYSVVTGPAGPVSAPRCNSSLKLAACSKGVGCLLPPGATAYPAGRQQPSKLFS